MSSSGDAPVEFIDTESKAHASWRRRLTVILAVCAVCVVVLAAVQLHANLTHKPHLVYPPGYEASLQAKPKVDPKLLDYFTKLYDLDNWTCEVGKRYGALCQNGEIDFGGSTDTCRDEGGVKGWVECR